MRCDATQRGRRSAPDQGDGNVFRFMTWAGDGSADTFRMNIWSGDEIGEIVVYDNGFDQELEGGSIIVHTAKK